MKLKVLPGAFSVCQILAEQPINRMQPFTFLSCTDEEISLVCPSEHVPANTVRREDGWRAFRIEGTLDFSLVGILSDIAGALAREHISIFALSTYNTDYVLVKEENFERALSVLCRRGYERT